MNSQIILTTILLLGAAVLHAWSADPKSPRKPNEVHVVLDPPTDNPVPSVEPAPEPEATEKELLTEELAPPGEPDLEPSDSEPPPTPPKGLAVRVEKLQTGNGEIDPAKVTLNAPFPAKPLAKAPAGWRLESSDHVPPIIREVELSPGKSITLRIRPHLLVPIADGTQAFSINEPGYEPALGYRQNTTVGAILSTSILQLEEDSKTLGNAIEKLQQLLVTLPKEEVPPQARPVKDAPPTP